MKIYAIGTLGKRQCAMRADGVWFERSRRENAPGWTRWARTVGGKRPDHAWYYPPYGNAKLPKD
jgi:hypothetical protein